MKIISLHSKKLLRVVTVSCRTVGLQTKVNIQFCEVKRISKKLSPQNLAKAIAIKNIHDETFYFQDVNRAEEMELENFCTVQIKKIAKRHGFNFQLAATNLRNSIEQLENGIEYLDPSKLAAQLDTMVVSDFEDGDLSVGGQGSPLQGVFAEAIHPQVGADSIHFLSSEASSIKLNQKHQATHHIQSGIEPILFKMKELGDSAKGIPSQEISHCLFEKLKSTAIDQKIIEDALQEMGELTEYDKAATLREVASLLIHEISVKQLKVAPKNGVVLFGDEQLIGQLGKRLRYLNPSCKIVSGHELDWPDETYMGGTLAILAALKVWGVASNLPKLTRAKRPVSLGKIIEL